MASLYDLADALSTVREGLKAIGAEADASTQKVRENAKAQAEARSAGMTSGSRGGAMGATSSRNETGTRSGISSTGGGSTSIETSSLGDPRNAADEAARMIASLEAAARR